MKILAVSDQEVNEIYELVPRGAFADVGLIVGCGDIHYEYLEYLVTLLNSELYYVPGNHDPARDPDSGAAQAAGCINLDLHTARAGGLLLAGFGGSVRYRPEGAHQYSQGHAFLRAALLLSRLWGNRARFGRALDILITHSPPFGLHDDDSRAHRGLRAINWLMRWARPRYVLHGHMHYRPSNLNRDVTWQGTSILNVFPYRVIEVPDAR